MSEDPQSDPHRHGACRTATVTGLAALAAALGLWIVQAVPALHLPPAGLFTAFGWLLAYARCTLKVAAFTRRPEAASRALVIDTALDEMPFARVHTPTLFEGFIARRSVYRACGYIGATAAAVMAAANIGMLVGILDLSGVNRAVFTVLMLTVASECIGNRVLGPQFAAADLAARQAEMAQRIAARVHLTVLDGGVDRGARGA